MRTPRIYTGLPPLVPGEEIELPGNAFRHVVQVLRLRPGAALVLFNGDGNDYPAILTDVGRRSACARIEDCKPNLNESTLRLHLVQAISKSDHMDITVQKAVELGVQLIQPVLSARGLRLPPERLSRKLEHWRAVAVSACEQCGRSRIPELRNPMKLDAWLESPASGAGIRVLLDPTATHGLEVQPRPHGSVELLIGPEGGFAPEELEQAASARVLGLRLGPRVLRTETAGIVAIALMQARWGDLV